MNLKSIIMKTLKNNNNHTCYHDNPKSAKHFRDAARSGGSKCCKCEYCIQYQLNLIYLNNKSKSS